MLPLHISFTVIVRLCECLATIRSVFAGALTGAFIFTKWIKWTIL